MQAAWLFLLFFANFQATQPDQVLTDFKIKVQESLGKPKLPSGARGFLQSIDKHIGTIQRSQTDSDSKMPDAYRATLTAHLQALGTLNLAAPKPQDLTRLADIEADLRAKADYAQAGAQSIELSSPNDQIAALAFSTSGDELLTGSLNGALRTWDASSGRELARQTFPDKQIHFIMADEQPYVLATTAKVKGFTIFRRDRRGTAFHEHFETSRGRPATATCAQISKLCAVGDNDGQLLLWNYGNSGDRPDQWSKQLRTKIDALALSQDGNSLLIADGSDLEMLSTKDFATAHKIGNQRAVSSAAIVGPADGVFTGSYDGTITSRSADLGHIRWQTQITSEPVWSMSSSPDNKVLAAAGGNVRGAGFLVLCDAGTGSVLERLDSPSPVVAMQFRPAGENALAATLADGTTRVWFWKRRRNPFEPITVTARTLNGQKDAGGYSVQYVPLAHRDDNNRVVSFPKPSTPTADNLMAGTYLIWASKDAYQSVQQHIRLDCRSDPNLALPVR
jgi:WD40 repeat protein